MPNHQPFDTNMVWVDTTNAGFTVDDLMVELAKEGIEISGSVVQFARFCITRSQTMQGSGSWRFSARWLRRRRGRYILTSSSLQRVTFLRVYKMTTTTSRHNFPPTHLQLLPLSVKRSSRHRFIPKVTTRWWWRSRNLLLLSANTRWRTMLWWSRGRQRDSRR